VAFQGNDTIAISFFSYNYSQTDTYNIATGEMVRRYPQLTNCSFNHTGTTMICAQSDFKLFDAKTGQTLLQIKPNENGYHYAVSDDGAYTAYCNANSETVFLWDTKTGQQLRYLKKNNQTACGYLNFSGDGQFLVSSTGAVWQIPQGVLVLEIPVQPIENNFWIKPQVDIATNNEFVLIYPNIYSLKSGNLLTKINSNGEWIRDAWFLADGFQLVLRGEDTLQFWGVKK
jgi:WD40 repeat protein